MTADPLVAVGEKQQQEGDVLVCWEGDVLKCWEPTIRDEYHALVRDHTQLIESGTNYKDMDAVVKLGYLAQLGTLEGRWDVVWQQIVSSCHSMINPQYTRQCKEFLTSMKLTENKYLEILNDTHQKMKDKAEKALRRQVRQGDQRQ